MKKIALALVVATPLVAYPLASWVIGGQIDSIFQRQYAELQGNVYVDIIERKTQRGIFSTEEVITLALKPEYSELLHLPNPDAEAHDAKPVQFVVRSRIDHGPLPGFTRLGLASAHSVLELDNPLVQKLYAGKSPLTVDTFVDFSGAGQQKILSPAVDSHFDGTAHLAWGEMVIDMDFNRDFSVINAQGRWPFMRVQSADGAERIEMNEMAMQAQQQRLSAEVSDIYTGPVDFTLHALEMQSSDASTPPLRVENMRFNSDVKANAGFINILAGYAADSIEVGEDHYRNAHFALALRHLEPGALAKINQISSHMDTSADHVDMVQLKPLLRPLQILLENSPEIAIERMGLSTAQGDIKASAQVRLPNANVGNLESAAENPLLLMSLATVLEADAQMALPEVLLKENLTPEQIEMLAAMIQAGYVLNKSGQLSTALSFAQGNVTINGKPLDPALMGMQ